MIRASPVHITRTIHIIQTPASIVHMRAIIVNVPIRRAQPDNYALLSFMVLFNQPEIYLIMSSIIKPNFIYFLFEMDAWKFA